MEHQNWYKLHFKMSKYWGIDPNAATPKKNSASPTEMDGPPPLLTPLGQREKPIPISHCRAAHPPHATRRVHHNTPKCIHPLLSA